ncbi:Glutathione S-transferase domain protein [Komagataeibacter xylinus E25]|nr:Glutathione S-transferase domain protein [Komagataeibacter xylinus E25]
MINGEHKRPDYLAINPLGLLPSIDDNGTIVFDSLAILTYLAKKYDPTRVWLPEDPVLAGEVASWLGFAAGPVEFAVGDARLNTLFGAPFDLGRCKEIANKYFPRMEFLIKGRSFLVSKRPTIADVANYTYLSLAPEGNISLDDYPNIQAWLTRVENLPGFVPMQKSAVGLWASTVTHAVKQEQSDDLAGR